MTCTLREVMVWEGITMGGRTDPVFLQGFLRAQQYLHDILQPNVRPFAGAVGKMIANFRPESNGACLGHASRRINPHMGNIHNAFAFREREWTAKLTNLPQDDLDNLILSMNNK
ncbi:hypothetical protein JTB14_006846 [Gonioctena quinquepunctata]|nr:hypothetical protein JTB14_006846 [Gonioctena quinquepunctata]